MNEPLFDLLKSLSIPLQRSSKCLVLVLTGFLMATVFLTEYMNVIAMSSSTHHVNVTGKRKRSNVAILGQMWVGNDMKQIFRLMFFSDTEAVTQILSYYFLKHYLINQGISVSKTFSTIG